MKKIFLYTLLTIAALAGARQFNTVPYRYWARNGFMIRTENSLTGSAYHGYRHDSTGQMVDAEVTSKNINDVASSLGVSSYFAHFHE
jgi:hypothetical protein